MRKNIHDLIIEDMLENLKDAWDVYNNPNFFNSISEDELLEDQERYIKALRNKKEVLRLQKLLKELS